MTETGYRTGVILVLAAGLLWSTMALFLRALPSDAVWQILLWRSLGMIPVLWAFASWRSGGRTLASIRATGRPGLVGALGLVAAFGGAIYAIQTTTVANAVFLFAASPLLTALLSGLVLGERVRPATWGAIALAAAGMAVMVREGLSAGALPGNLAALASAAGFAVFTLSLRRGRSGDMMPALILGAAFSSAAALAVLLAQGAELLLAPWQTGLALGLGAVHLGLGLALYTLGSRAVPAAELTLLSMTEVLFAPLWVWLLLDETASPATLFGGGIVLLAIAANALSGARRRSAPA